MRMSVVCEVVDCANDFLLRRRYGEDPDLTEDYKAEIWKEE